MIRYKVVNVDRGSCRVPVKNYKHYKKYNKDTVVKMTPGSFGIMVFKSISQAETFREKFEPILQVRPIGKAMKRPPYLFGLKCLQLSISTLYNYFKAHEYKDVTWDIPQGTLFYRAVEVLN